MRTNHEEVRCAEWLKTRPPQALRDVRAKGKEMAGTEEDLYVEINPGVGHGSD